MALKNLILVGFVFAAIAMEMSGAQFGSSPNGIDIDLLGIAVTLYCTPDGNMGSLGLVTPPFIGADVIFQCGNNSIIAKTTTNIFGFSYLVTSSAPVQPFSPPESNCKVVVNTTLSTCNPLLPSSGRLQSDLKPVGNFAVGGLKVSNFAPTGFHYMNSSI